jgi:hypothetical protein
MCVGGTCLTDRVVWTWTPTANEIWVEGGSEVPIHAINPFPIAHVYITVINDGTVVLVYAVYDMTILSETNWSECFCTYISVFSVSQNIIGA